MNWTTEIPTEEGLYWFWGDPHRGGMGMDFHSPEPIKPEMCLVEAFQPSSGGLIMTTNGHFVTARKFSRSGRSEGVAGYWMKAELPEPPTCTEEFENALKLPDAP